VADAWGTFRELHLAARGRKYTSSDADGPAMKRLVANTERTCAEAGREGDFIALLRHRLSRFFADPDPFLAREGFAVVHVDRQLPKYGVPWALAAGPSSPGHVFEPPPRIDPAEAERNRQAALAAPRPDFSGFGRWGAS
jgi:hypothetical protein